MEIAFLLYMGGKKRRDRKRVREEERTFIFFKLINQKRENSFSRLDAKVVIVCA